MQTKTTWFADEHRRKFAKELGKAHPHERIDTLFGRFLFVAAGSFQQASRMIRGAGRNEELEENIIREQKQCKRPEQLARAMVALATALEQKPYDFLGSFYQEIESNVRPAGQFFTPSAVCDCMASISVHDIPRGNREHPLRIAEPASGMGAMVIATDTALKKNHWHPREYWFHATDIDRRCAYGTYIQTTLLDIPAVVTHGNTLTTETWEAHWNVPALTHGHDWREDLRRITEARTKPEAKPKTNGSPASNGQRHQTPRTTTAAPSRTTAIEDLLNEIDAETAPSSPSTNGSAKQKQLF